MTMLNKLISGTPDGIAWFADQAPLHASELLDILRSLEREAPNVLALRFEAQAVLNKMARTADEGSALDACDAQYFRGLPR